MGIPRENLVPDFASYTEEGRINRARFARGELGLYVQDYIEQVVAEAIGTLREDSELFEKAMQRVEKSEEPK